MCIRDRSSTTLINTSNYFETDDVGEIQPKIDELELTFPSVVPDEIELPDPFRETLS